MVTTRIERNDGGHELPVGFMPPQGFSREGHEVPLRDPRSDGATPVVPIPGAISLDLDKKFAVDLVSGKSYLNNLSTLIDIVTGIDTRVFRRDRALARIMMERNMEVRREEVRKEIQIPSVSLFRRKSPSDDTYIGFSTQRVCVIPTTQGDIPLLYWTTRAFDEGYRDMEFGRKAVQIGRVTHRVARWGAHRTQVEIAVRSMQRSGVFKEGRFFPWDNLYSTDKLSRQLLNGLFDRVAINGVTVDQETGVSRDDYYESNVANRGVDVNHPSLAAIHRKFEEFGITGRNSVYGVGEFV